MMTRRLLCFSLLCLWLTSCNRDEEIPSFIQVDEFQLTTDLNTQGINTTDIREVKVTANGQNLGLFGLPATIPVLEEGPTNIILSPVIRQDGLANARVVYPFYTFHASSENLVSEEVLEITPSISYLEDLNFWLENFDNSINFNSASNSEGEFEREDNTSIAFGGDGASASVVFDSEEGTYFFSETDENFFWQVGSAVFLELNYSCNQPFTIGATSLSGVTLTRRDLIIVNTSTETDQTEWRKLYVNLTDFVADNLNTDGFELYFKLGKDPSVSETQVYLDNLKVIRF